MISIDNVPALYQNKYSNNSRVNYCLISPSEFCGIALVDTWRFSKSTWRSRWGSFTLTHNPTKFNGHWRCETGDVLFANIAWSHDRWVTLLHSCGQLKLSHTLIKLVAVVLEKVEIKSFLHITWSHDQWFTWLGG